MAKLRSSPTIYLRVWYNIVCMIIQENVLISSLTTMRLGGAARYVIKVEAPEDVREAYKFAQEHNLPVWPMGGGANTIGRDEGFEGVIIINDIHGIKKISEDNDTLVLQAMGGEEWDDLVEYACNLGYSGIEAMSLIPGTVGAAPVQNIGAYGQDVAQVIETAEVYDTKNDEYITLTKDEMQLGYRHTRFNHGADAGKFFIIAITLRLHKTQLEPPFYNSLQKYIDEHEVTDFSPQNIRKIVCEIRESKLPNPEKFASAGSFFKNIYLDADEAKEAEKAGVQLWRNADGSGKINSGWLIEQCELKGQKLHGMRVSDKAALVLINEDAKSYADLAAARKEIIDKVAARFGFTLEQEPVEIK